MDPISQGLLVAKAAQIGTDYLGTERGQKTISDVADAGIDVGKTMAKATIFASIFMPLCIILSPFVAVLVIWLLIKAITRS